MWYKFLPPSRRSSSSHIARNVSIHRRNDAVEIDVDLIPDLAWLWLHAVYARF
jgi:hypothetical protein